MVRFLRFEPIQTRRVFLVFLLVSAWDTCALFASGGYDHGTSTGKGKLEVDLTWNPFDLFKNGQTYIVVGYGLTDRVDIHGYFSHPASGLDNYYYGGFFQFLRTKRIDLATAVGIRQYRQSEAIDLFAPQLLYNVRIISGYTVGGSIVDIRSIKNGKQGRWGTAFDIAVFIPITKYIPCPDYVDEIKVGIGAFRPGTYVPIRRKLLPTYSIDTKLNWTKNDDQNR